VNKAQAERRWDSSTWAVMSRDPAIFRRLGWRACDTEPGAKVWTDDFSNVFGALRWG
jgi:hypothetical protein